MSKLIFIIIFLLSCVPCRAQLNYVRNPDFEEYTYCPSAFDQIEAATFWNASDSMGSIGIKGNCRPEYCHVCGTSGAGVPDNVAAYQFPRSGSGMAGALFFCDEAPPPAVPYYVYRDYLQGRLFKKLKAGVSYCVTFYVSLGEASGYANDKIGAYLDDGSIDTVSICSKPITFVTPQVYTTSVILDTANWTKVEGSFTANGTEKFITIGNFFSKAATSYVVTNYFFIFTHHSYYVIDDVSVIETNLEADAGIDKAVHIGDSVWIGRGLDSTKGLDCKWYYKGALVDSGAGMYAKAGTIKGIDTYVVVQTICGLVKTDTVLVYTFPVGVDELPDVQAQFYTIYPNPSDGNINIAQKVADAKPVEIIVFNALGSIVYQTRSLFSANAMTLHLGENPSGLFLIQFTDQKGQSSKLTFTIQK